MMFLKSMSILLAALLCGAATAEEMRYPVRPVKIVVPFGPGGPTDVFARLLAQKISAKLGQQFYIENQAGAGGNIGMAAVARAKPDGHTLLVASSSFVANPSLYARVSFDPIKDFEPITLAALTPNILVVHPSFPATTVNEMIAYVKANPGKYSFASSGAGTAPHLTAEVLKASQGLDLVHIPFSGSGPAIQSVVGGHTLIGFTVMTPAVGQVLDGKLRALAVTTTRRSPALPNVPTLVEQGLTGLESDTMQGFLAPAHTPKAIIDVLQKEIVAAMNDPEVQSRMAQLGFDAVGDTPEQFKARIETEIPKWAKVIKDANLRVE